MAIRKQPRPAWIDHMHKRRLQREVRRLNREFLEQLELYALKNHYRHRPDYRLNLTQG